MSTCAEPLTLVVFLQVKQKKRKAHVNMRLASFSAYSGLDPTAGYGAEVMDVIYGSFQPRLFRYLVKAC